MAFKEIPTSTTAFIVACFTLLGQCPAQNISSNPMNDSQILITSSATASISLVIFTTIPAAASPSPVVGPASTREPAIKSSQVPITLSNTSYLLTDSVISTPTAATGLLTSKETLVPTVTPGVPLTTAAIASASKVLVNGNNSYSLSGISTPRVTSSFSNLVISTTKQSSASTSAPAIFVITTSASEHPIKTSRLFSSSAVVVATASIRPTNLPMSSIVSISTTNSPMSSIVSISTTNPPTTTKPHTTYAHVVNFKITNASCTSGIKENNPNDTSFKDLKMRVEYSVNLVYKNDIQYKGAELSKFICGSVIAVVKIKSTSNDESIALKKLKDAVGSGNVGQLLVDKTSYSNKTPSSPDPFIYVTLETTLSNNEFCPSINDLKHKLASLLIMGTTTIKSSEVVFFDNKCTDLPRSGTEIAKPRFYISTATNINNPDKVLTIRISKLIEQSIESGNTGSKLGALFHKKIKSAKLNIPEKELSDTAKVFIGIGVVLGLLLLVVVIILICSKRPNDDAITTNKTPMTIENQAYDMHDSHPVLMTPLTKDPPNAIFNAGFDRSDDGTKINLDDHDYEYPSAPQNGSASRTKDHLIFQPLTTEEEVNTINFEVESVPLANVITTPVKQEAGEEKPSVFKYKPKDLSFEELALRKGDEQQMRKEFENLDYTMPNSNVYPASLSEKNRLMNVVPRPETRVILSSSDENLNSDYINANFVRDSQQKKQYILTQAPLEITANDFWRMVWEHGASLIVMVTPLVQMGMEKCFQYWPPDSIARKYGKIQVQLKKKELKPDFSVTTMSVKLGDESRDIILYRFMTWPDDNIPDNMKSVVSFLLTIRQMKKAKDNDNLVVVHCSDGVGISSCFVAIDLGMQSLEAERSVDVYSLVKSLRKDRAGAVQVFEQYKFIYRALYEYAVHLGADQAGYILSNSAINQSDADSRM